MHILVVRRDVKWQCQVILLSSFLLRNGYYLFLFPRNLEYPPDVPYHQRKYEHQIKSFRNHDITLVTCEGEIPVELRWLEIEAHLHSLFILFVCFWRDSHQWARTSSFTRFLDHTKRRNTFGRIPLDELSARRRDLYLTTNNTHNWHSCPRWDSKPQSQEAGGRRPTP